METVPRESALNKLVAVDGEAVELQLDWLFNSILFEMHAVRSFPSLSCEYPPLDRGPFKAEGTYHTKRYVVPTYHIYDYNVVLLI